jgi:hypothetical protein
MGKQIGVAKEYRQHGQHHAEAVVGVVFVLLFRGDLRATK